MRLRCTRMKYVKNEGYNTKIQELLLLKKPNYKIKVTVN